MLLGNIIKDYRTKHNLSLREFSNRCGLSHSYIDSIEKNRDTRTGQPVMPTLDAFGKIANAMNLNIDSLLAMTLDKTETPKELPEWLKPDKKEEPIQTTKSINDDDDIKIIAVGCKDGIKSVDELSPEQQEEVKTLTKMLKKYFKK